MSEHIASLPLWQPDDVSMSAVTREAVRREVDALAWELVAQLAARATLHSEPEVQILLDRRSPKV